MVAVGKGALNKEHPMFQSHENGGRKPKVVLFDLWKTLVTSHCKEPVWNAQRIIGHQVNPVANGFGVDSATNQNQYN